MLLDWKRVKKIEFDNPFRTLKEPLEHLSDCNGNLYSLQLNVYAHILSSEYNFTVSGLYLGQVHPCLGLRPRLISIPHMPDEIALMVEDQIAKGQAVSPALPGADAPFELPEKA